jgi:hypothetical protein
MARIFGCDIGTTSIGFAVVHRVTFSGSGLRICAIFYGECRVDGRSQAAPEKGHRNPDQQCKYASLTLGMNTDQQCKYASLTLGM